MLLAFRESFSERIEKSRQLPPRSCGEGKAAPDSDAIATHDDRLRNHVGRS